jgi:protein-tyrosine phosphatase
LANQAGQSRTEGIEVDAANQTRAQQQVTSAPSTDNVPPRGGFIDLHCHVLWGLDDGPRSPEESLDLCRTLVSDGVAVVAATCHQRGVFTRNRPDTIRRRAHELAEQLSLHQIPLEIHPSAEWLLDAQTVEQLSHLVPELLTLADRQKFALVEFPFQFPTYLSYVAETLAEHGLVGVLAHVEKYHQLLTNPGRLETLLDDGFVTQMNADSIAGRHGQAVMHACRSLIQRGLIHLVASDAHSVDRRPPMWSAAWDNVLRWTDPETAELLFRTNPQSLIAGTPPHLAKRMSWLDRFRKR